MITMMTSHDAINEIIKKLHLENQRPKVWSIVVTIYGDVVLPHGGGISLMVLNKIMQRMQIGSGALRTAMSRLSSSGWLQRSRDGRASLYSPTKEALEITWVASKRIYANLSNDEWTGNWQLAFLERNDKNAQTITQLQSYGFITISGTIYARFASKQQVVPEITDNKVIWFLAENQDQASKQKMLEIIQKNDRATQLYAKLIKRFQPLLSSLDPSAELDPLDALVARILLIHYWRRAILLDKNDNVINEFKRQAYFLTKELYGKLLLPSEAWLQNYANIKQDVNTKKYGNLEQRF